MNQSSSKQIKIGAILSYVGIVINMISGLIYTPWIISSIGSNGYGLFTLASSLVSMFMMDFGISSGVSRYLSQYLVNNEQDKINRFMSIVYKVYIFIDVIIIAIFLVVYFNIEFFYSNLTIQELNQFKIIFIIISVYNVVAFPFVPLSGIMTAYEKFIELKTCAILNKVMTVISTIFFLVNGGGLFALVFINVFWNLVFLIVKYVIVNNQSSIKINLRYWDSTEAKKLFTFSSYATIISIMSRFIFNFMPSILAACSGAQSTALFGIVSTLEGYVFTFSDGINGLFLKKTAGVMNSQVRDQKLLELMIKIGRINLSIVALVVIGFVVSGNEFVKLWIGDGYHIIYVSTVLIILPGLLYYPQQIARNAIIVENKLKYQAFIYGIVAILNVIMACLFCPKYGVLGAAISICCSTMARTILMNILFEKKLNINIRKFYWNCFNSMILPIIFTLLVGSAIFKIITFSNWFVFIFKCILVVLVYLIFLWKFGWNQSEKKMVKSIFLKIKR